MSQKDILQPGEKLRKVIELTAELKRKITRIVENPNPDYKAFDKFIETISTRIGIDPDNYKYIYDQLYFEADRYEQSSNNYADLALVARGTAEAIEMQLRTYMESHALTQISGETWRYELEAMEPAINIEYLIQIFVPDEHKIKSHAAMGKEIKGVAITKRTQMKKTVNKKEVIGNA
jgi:hypothetical protein